MSKLYTEVTLEQRNVIWSDSFSCSAKRCCQVTSSAEFYCTKEHIQEPLNNLSPSYKKSWDPTVSMGAGRHYAKQHKLVKASVQFHYQCAHPLLMFLLLLGLLLTDFLTFYSIAGLLQRCLFIVSPCNMAHHGLTLS